MLYGYDMFWLICNPCQLLWMSCVAMFQLAGIGCLLVPVSHTSICSKPDDLAPPFQAKACTFSLQIDAAGALTLGVHMCRP